MAVSDLIAFLYARLAEEEQTAFLFHELGCPGHAWCCCPVPWQILGQVSARRGIVRDCEQQLRFQGTQAPGWPMMAIAAQLTLGAFTLPYEMHQHWQEPWRP